MNNQSCANCQHWIAFDEIRERCIADENEVTSDYYGAKWLELISYKDQEKWRLCIRTISTKPDVLSTAKATDVEGLCTALGTVAEHFCSMWEAR